jgi:hypothetical protein
VSSATPSPPASARARRITLRVTRADVQDAAFLAALSVVALIGFRTTYSGQGYLLVGIAGLGLGLLIGHFANVLHQPIIAIAAVTVLTFFLFGGAVALRAQTAGGVLPTVSALRHLASVSVNGWKQLVTTLPPVDGGGPLLALPYLLGLASGAIGMTMARRLRNALIPLLAPVALLAVVILLGTAQPAARWLQGLGFAALALAWAAVRSQRANPLVQNGTRQRSRAITAASLLVVTAPVAAGLGPHLPGVSNHKRVVARTYVEPPLDMNTYASPLVGFRKYTKDAKLLYDQKLLTVSGLPAGQRLRFAVLDSYSGSVWGASSGSLVTAEEPEDSFQRVGSRIPATGDGSAATVKVTIAPVYAAIADASAWLPEAGHLTTVSFSGADGAAHADAFRYNLATSAGIVIDRLQAGDMYTLHTVLPSANSRQLRPYGQPVLPTEVTTFVASRAAQWSGRASDVWSQVQAVAAHLRNTGFYSDGGPGEGQYLPGHSVGRLTSFLNSTQVVGDDEQYAAAFSLLANNLGMPARVVLGATPEGDGTVKGRDVHAWVEVHLGDNTWQAIPETVFMPPQSKKPTKQPPQRISNAAASIVPPPNATRPPSTLDSAATADTNSLHSNPNRKKAAGAPFRIPHFLVTTAQWGGPPLLFILLIAGGILACKARRRSRRRLRGAAPTRIARGWYEIVDLARDLGLTVPTGTTRREQAAAIAHDDVNQLATAADANIFGPITPSAEAAADYWSLVDATRRTMTGSLSRWRRIRTALSLRSLLPNALIAAYAPETKP